MIQFQAPTKYKSELHFQSIVISEFRILYPNKIGQLINIINDPRINNISIGMVTGASDLFYINNLGVLFIELKLENSRHNKDHVLNQLNFGYNKIFMNHQYIISSSLNRIFESIQDFDNGSLKTEYNIKICIENLKKIKTKTFVFNDLDFYSNYPF